jgi:hypothetical protein
MWKDQVREMIDGMGSTAGRAADSAPRKWIRGLPDILCR